MPLSVKRYQAWCSTISIPGRMIGVGSPVSFFHGMCLLFLINEYVIVLYLVFEADYFLENIHHVLQSFIRSELDCKCPLFVSAGFIVDGNPEATFDRLYDFPECSSLEYQVALFPVGAFVCVNLAEGYFLIYMIVHNLFIGFDNK